MVHVGYLLAAAVGVAANAVDWEKFWPRKQARQRQCPAGTRELAATASPHPAHKRRLGISTGIMALAFLPRFGLRWLLPFNLVSIGWLAGSIYKEAWHAIFKERKIRVDILDAVVISLCLLFGRVATTAFMVWILDLADMLLERTRRQSEAYIADIFGKQVAVAWLVVGDKDSGTQIETPVKDLKQGDVIVVSDSEQVPVDGVVVDGFAMLDQHSLTGESAPAEKRRGEKVFASTIVVSGRIYVEVEETGENTLASQIVNIVNEAAEHKVKIQSSGEVLADRMVIPTLGLGALGFATTGPGAMLAIINADYGTGIRVAAPIALLASLGRAAKRGILVKDSSVLESLHEIDVVLFDKTGTLTEPVPSVSNIVAANGRFTAEDVLYYTAVAEQRFTHPIASAILQRAAQMDVAYDRLDESHCHVGLGVEVKHDGRLIRVGSSRYMDHEGIDIPAHLQEACHTSRQTGKTLVFTALDDRIAGMIELKSTIRPEARQVIADLRARGVTEFAVISGDHEAPTRDLAGELGFERYFAEVLPQEKADYVRLLQKEGKKVMMVGDGINDAAALSYADIAVSLAGASTIATDVADVVFMDGNLSKFDVLYSIADELQRNVKRSFHLITIPNTFCILGALAGVFGLSASLVLNNGFNFLAASNGMLLHRDTKLPEPARLPAPQPHAVVEAEVPASLSMEVADG